MGAPAFYRFSGPENPLLNVAEEVSAGNGSQAAVGFGVSVKKSFHFVHLIRNSETCFGNRSPAVYRFSGLRNPLLNVAEEVGAGNGSQAAVGFGISVKKSFHFVFLRNSFNSSR